MRCSTTMKCIFASVLIAPTPLLLLASLILLVDKYHIRGDLIALALVTLSAFFYGLGILGQALADDANNPTDREEEP